MIWCGIGEEMTNAPFAGLRRRCWSFGSITTAGSGDAQPRRMGVAVYGMHRSGDAPAFASRFSTGRFVWDSTRDRPADSVARLVEIGGELGGRPILLPTNDETALFLAAHAAL